jgi:hypothetical protein
MLKEFNLERISSTRLLNDLRLEPENRNVVCIQDDIDRPSLDFSAARSSASATFLRYKDSKAAGVFSCGLSS